VIIAVYWATDWVQSPVFSSFDPRSPKQIRDAYAAAVKNKKKRLTITQTISGLAAGMVAMSLMTASLGKTASTSEHDLAATIGTTKGVRSLSITAKIKDAERVMLSIEAVGPPKDAQIANSILLPTKPEGLIQVSTEITNAAHKFNVALEWTNQVGNAVRISKILSEPQDK
jgi:hypothetical protein